MIILLAAALAVASAAPVPARIEDVAARPAAFDGRWVVLRGQIDQCMHFGCAICAEDAVGRASADQCLAIDWDRERGTAKERGIDADPLYRYASVEVVARFDKACLDGTCTDRAPVLFDARVTRVIKRRPSALGLNSRRAIDRLIDPPAAAAAPLIALLRRIDQDVDSATNPRRYRVFADRSDPAVERYATICRSWGPDGNPATWPVDETAAVFAPSTEDIFRCFFARRTDGQWLISPD